MSKSRTITFNHNARTVFTGTKNAIEACGLFRSIKADSRTFRITASRGFPLFGEDIEIHVVASSPNSSRVEIKSADKLVFNILKWGNNIRNVDDLADFISNRINSYMF